jgi:hypothetical protein
MFETSHEKDLESDVNKFISKLSDEEIIDIKYQMGMIPEPEEEDRECSTFCFSAMVMYTTK